MSLSLNLNFRALSTGAAIAVLAVGSVQAETLRFLTPWGQSSEGNYVNSQIIMRLVEEISDGEMSLQRFDNSVVPPFEQFEPVASGVFDIHYTNPAYHSGATVVGQIAETASSDPEVRRGSGLWDMIDEAYQERNMKLVSLGPSTGYQFLTLNPIGEDGGLDGLRIRSNPAYDGVIRALGGAPVQMPVPEIYSALQRAMIDGTAYPGHGLVASRMNEVSNYMVRPMFGQGSSMLLMNLDRWNSLSEEQQEIMLEAGRRFEVEAFEAVIEIAARDEAEMIELGVEITELGPEYADRINDIYNEGVWTQAAANGGEEAQRLIDFVQENDIVFQGHD